MSDEKKEEKKEFETRPAKANIVETALGDADEAGNLTDGGHVVTETKEK